MPIENLINTNEPPKMFKVSETARILNVTNQHVRNLIRSGVIPAVIVGRATRIPRDWVIQMSAGHSPGKIAR